MHGLIMKFSPVPSYFLPLRSNAYVIKILAEEMVTVLTAGQGTVDKSHTQFIKPP